MDQGDLAKIECGEEVVGGGSERFLSRILFVLSRLSPVFFFIPPLLSSFRSDSFTFSSMGS